MTNPKSIEIEILTSRKYRDQPGWINFLQEDINEKLAQGWKMHGSIFASRTEHEVEFFQAMIKEAPNDDKQ